MTRRPGLSFGVAVLDPTGADAQPLAALISASPFAGAKRIDGCLRDG